ncbi:MAG: hypothetical protein QOI06_231 [Nocardioidaceae bacterium]|nr:hypothetical protein [Nocardioidaceae bacterium]
MALSDDATATIDRARRDPAFFAEALIGHPLWAHQLEVVESPARYRVIAAGRRAGKTRVFGVLSLHKAFSQARSKVLIVSAGDRASKRMFADVAGMAANAPLLAGSVADETTSLLTLTNGSTIECVPASMAQVRSAESDLLIIDEAGFVPQAIFDAAEPTVVARKGSRVLICSTPWGTSQHFFRQLWRRGMDAPDEKVTSWHWPSTVSPLVDQELLEDIKGRTAPLTYAREYLAEFVDEVGAYFTMAELEAAIDDEHPLVDPDVEEPAVTCPLGQVVGGVDWGFRRDANALVVVGALSELDEKGRVRYWLPWLEERFDLSYETWVERLVWLSSRFVFGRLSAETNGVGQMPAQVLARQMWKAGRGGVVEGVTTTARLKEDAFGFLKLLLSQGRLRLPRHVSLLKQLGALEYTMTESGQLRIAVPETQGHDDLAMSLCLAVLPLMAGEFAPVVETLVTMDDLEPGFDAEFDYLGGY